MAGERTIKVRFDGDSSGLRSAAVSGERAVSGLGDGVKTTTTSLRQSGVAAQRTAVDFGTLDRQLTAVGKSVRATQEEIVKTGNTRLFGDLRKQENELKKLTNLRKVFADEGGPAATGFVAQFAGKVGPLMARLPLSGPLGLAVGAAALAAAPVIGATIAGAIVGGAGLGGVIGGAIIASKDPRVKAAFGSLSSSVGAQLTRAAEPFVPAMLSAVSEVRAGFGELDDDLRSIFADSAGFVAPLTKGIMSAVASVTAGVSSLTAVAGPTMRVIGDGIAAVGDAIGDVMQSLSDNGPEAALAMRDFFSVIEGGIRTAGALVNGLTELYGWIRIGKAGLSGDTGTIVAWAEAHRTGKTAVDQSSTAVQQMGLAVTTTAHQVDLLTAAQQRQAGIALSAAEANLGYRTAVESARQAVDGKRKVSLAEEQQLLSLVRATNANTESMEQSGATAKQVSAAFNGSRAEIVKVGTAMGMTKQAAERYATSLLNIPTSRTTKIVLDSQSAIAGARNIVREIGKIKGKTVRINIAQSGEYGADDQGALHGPGRRAWGGPVFSGRQYLVGENGPEILTMGAGGSGHVTPNGSAPMGAPTVNLTVELDGQPFYAYATRTADAAVDTERHRQQAGKR